jgi:hypothetical protein
MELIFPWDLFISALVTLLVVIDQPAVARWPGARC